MISNINLMKKKAATIFVLAALIFSIFATIPTLQSADINSPPDSYDLDEIMKMLEDQRGDNGLDLSGDNIYPDDIDYDNLWPQQ